MRVKSCRKVEEKICGAGEVKEMRSLCTERFIWAPIMKLPQIPPRELLERMPVNSKVKSSRNSKGFGFLQNIYFTP